MRAALVACLLLCAPLALGGCAAPSSYAGIPLAAGAADPELQSLARRARAGHNQAQLELGIRYEEGRGVPRDLAKARNLYFRAATRPSRKRTAIYVPTPGGAVSSYVRTLPAGREYSGLQEALVRWHRLMTVSEEVSGRTSGPPSPDSAGDQASYSGLPEDRREAERLLDDFHAFQPIFNGLKAGDGRWQERIAAEPGARFFTPLSVADSFSAIFHPAPAGAGKPVSIDQIRALCAGELGRHASQGTAQRRLTGLCALADCRAVNRETWQAAAGSLAAAIPANPAEAPAGDAERLAAHDVAFLFRVSALCGERKAAEKFLAAAKRFSHRLAAERRACEQRGCSQDEAEQIDRRRIAADMHLLLAVSESEIVPLDLAAEAARHWIESRLPAPPPIGDRDATIDELCSRAAVSPGDCRRKYPHSFFLEQRYLETIARALSDHGSGASVCTILSSFHSAHRAEIGYRFAQAPIPNRLTFAARCSLSEAI